MPKVSYHIEDLKDILSQEKPSNITLVTSRNIATHLASHIQTMGISASRIVYVPDGESAKRWDVLEKLLIDFSDQELDRSSVVLALGGGSIGDLVGFASSIYLRGIKYIQIPTTLLAQVDSAHGGKTGVDFHGYKNSVGTIYEPCAVVMDIKLLGTLTEKQIIDGLGEIIKCGLIHDPEIISILQKETVAGLMVKSGKHSLALQDIIKRTVAVKNFYTRDDMKDKGVRSMLNFGHTYGHAVELTHQISHGEAVIIGMLQELAFTESRGISHASVQKDLIQILDQLGILDRLSLKTPDGVSTKKYVPDVESLRHDKKVQGATIALPVVYTMGRSGLEQVNLSDMASFVQKL